VAKEMEKEMKVLILEDEFYASDRLKKLLRIIDSSIEILAVIETVENAILWIKNNREPDLMFVDIQLSDGISLDIFEKIQVECAIIFTTAYDEYAIQAFKVNSIDYLLKPINLKNLKNSIEKYKRLKDKYAGEIRENIKILMNQLDLKKEKYKTRLLVKTGSVMQSINIEKIAYFFIKNQLCFLMTKDKERFALDYNLDEIERLVNPEMFFRVNRQVIVSQKSIKKIHPFFSSRLLLDLEPDTSEDVIVSKRKVSLFKKWMGG
jgi:two-component system LytT family response regulator